MNIIDVSKIIPPNKIRGLKTLSSTKGGMISEHVKNHSAKDGANKMCHPRQRVVFNEKEINKILAETNEPSYNEARRILKKALKLEGLNLKDTATLLNMDSRNKVLTKELFSTAFNIKNKIYGQACFVCPLICFELLL